MALPTMTPEQREAALAKAAQSRRERSVLIAAVRSGDLSVADVLDREDEIAKRTRVVQVLRALAGYGPVRVAAALDACGIDDKRRVGALSEAQRARLIGVING